MRHLKASSRLVESLGSQTTVERSLSSLHWHHRVGSRDSVGVMINGRVDNRHTPDRVSPFNPFRPLIMEQ